MKKLLLVLVLTLVLFMSGCGENELRKTDEYYCENDYDGTWNELLKQCDYNYYTQEEVDLLIREIEDSFDAQAMNNLNERVLELESELRDFDKFDYEDLIEFEEYFYGTWVNDLEIHLEETYVEESYLWAHFYDSFSEDIIQYLEENYQPLEEVNHDYQLALTTLATLDIMIMMVEEHGVQILNETELSQYESMVAMRDTLYNELEEGGIE